MCSPGRRLMVVIASLCLSVSTSSATAATGNPIIAAHQAPYGKSYEQWAGRFWQWFLSIPATVHPFTDMEGTHCGIAQEGPVWFLVGDPTFGDGGVERACTIPAGKAILFPIVNAECSTLEEPPFFGANRGQLRKCVRDIGFSDADSLYVTIDGKQYDSRDLHPFRLSAWQSPVSGIVVPDDNAAGIDTTTKGNAGRSVAGGYYVMIAPLSPGTHSLEFRGTVEAGPFAGFTQQVSYELTVSE